MNFLDIVDVVRNFLELKPTSSPDRFVALCPFHPDKNPSFYLYRSTSSYFCFGCKVSGKIQTFLEKYNNWDWKQAKEYLEHNYPEFFQKEDLDILKQCSQIWYQNSEKYGEEIFERFGFKWKTVLEKEIGIADKFTNNLIKKNFSVEQLRDVGLIIPNNDYLLFNNRITIPLTDKHRKIIGFQARNFNMQISSKYLTSCNNIFFKREDYLYNEKVLFEEDEIALVEGLKDVFAFEKIGYPAIASLGTQLGSGQIEKLQIFLNKKSSKLIIMFDNDIAGEEAYLKLFNSFNWFHQNKIFRAEIPLNSDPADMNQQELEKAIYSASNTKIINKRKWRFKTQNFDINFDDLILPKYLRNNLPTSNIKAKIASIQDLKLVRIFLSKIRIDFWKDNWINFDLNLKVLSRLNIISYRYALYLSINKYLRNERS